MTEKLDTLEPGDLVCACGGLNMKLTQFGYPGDPYSDSETRKGHGAYRHLQADTSVAMTDSALGALGLTRKGVTHTPTWVDIHLKGGGTLHRRIDDRAPERDRRIDLYQRSGFDRHLPDRADITLSR